MACFAWQLRSWLLLLLLSYCSGRCQLASSKVGLGKTAPCQSSSGLLVPVLVLVCYIFEVWHLSWITADKCQAAKSTGLWWLLSWTASSVTHIVIVNPSLPSCNGQLLCDLWKKLIGISSEFIFSLQKMKDCKVWKRIIIYRTRWKAEESLCLPENYCTLGEGSLT